jgi:hypothetical protein
MEALIAAVAVALIGGPVMWFLKRIDEKNTAQHAAAQDARLSAAVVVKDELGATTAALVSRFDSLDVHLARHDAKLDHLNDLVAGHLAFHAHASERQHV